MYIIYARKQTEKTEYLILYQIYPFKEKEIIYLFIFTIYLYYFCIFLYLFKSDKTLGNSYLLNGYLKKYCGEKIIIFKVYYCTECIKVSFIILAHKTACRLNY